MRLREGARFRRAYHLLDLFGRNSASDSSDSFRRGVAGWVAGMTSAWRGGVGLDLPLKHGERCQRLGRRLIAEKLRDDLLGAFAGIERSNPAYLDAISQQPDKLR